MVVAGGFACHELSPFFTSAIPRPDSAVGRDQAIVQDAATVNVDHALDFAADSGAADGRVADGSFPDGLLPTTDARRDGMALYTEAGGLLGDLDGDGDVDRDDLDLLKPEHGKAVGNSTCGPPCDINGDGVINVADSRSLVARCTRPRCATQ